MGTAFCLLWTVIGLNNSRQYLPLFHSLLFAFLSPRFTSHLSCMLFKGDQWNAQLLSSFIYFCYVNCKWCFWDSFFEFHSDCRITSMSEAGLYNYWEMDVMPNSSACDRVPTKITVSSSLSLRQCWVGRDLNENLKALLTER